MVDTRVTRPAAAMNILKTMVHRPALSIIPGTWPNIHCVAVRTVIAAAPFPLPE